MSRHATDWAWETDPGSSSLKLILLSMADRADEYNLCYMAGQVQGEYVELSDGTLSWLGNALYWMPLPEPPQEVNRG